MRDRNISGGFHAGDECFCRPESRGREIGFFNGLGRTAFVMVQGIVAAFVVRIPFAYVMSKVMGRLFYIGLCIPCSTLEEIIVCFVYYRYMRRKSAGG